MARNWPAFGEIGVCDVSVRGIEKRWLTLLAVGVGTDEKLIGLDKDRLNKSIWSATAALFRQKKVDGVMFHNNGEDQ